ncbi:hypothetical protein [Saccharothrix xinjiangensis]|uniref:Uncharacterized protein n=1 Tax=Saccharothrix xinjiangensis TaxID=204798 RepID=A0ABV9Y6I6_9PSEU
MNANRPQWGLPLGGDPVKYLLAFLALAVGVAAVVLGGADDSPGLQFIGLVIVLCVVGHGVRTARRGG